MGALDAAGADRAARWNAEDVARRMDFSLRSRLRARHQALAHASRQRRRRRRTISWPVFEEMRDAGAAGSSCRPPACSASKACATTELVRRDWPNASPPPSGVLGAVTYMVPDLEELLDQRLRRGDRARARPRFPCRRDRRRRGDLAEEDRRGGALEPLRGQHPGRPLLLAGAPARSRRARHAGQGGARPGSPSCRCRCAISTCRTAAATAPRRAGAA